MPTRAFLDWLEITDPAAANGIDSAIDAFQSLFAFTRDQWHYKKPLPHYKWAAGTDSGLLVLSGREDMGAHLVAPGGALSDLLRANLQIDHIIAESVKRDCSFSRIDTAIDVTDMQLDVMELRAIFLSGGADARTKKHNLQLSENGGLTWYVGSWHTDHFLRIYNKYSELARHADVPTTKDWVRVELVNRDRYADEIARLIAATHDIPSVVRTAILSFIDFPSSPQWTKALRGHILALGPSMRTIGNTRKWLNGPVAMALAREIMGDPGYRAEHQRMIDAALEVLRQQEEKRKTNF